MKDKRKPGQSQLDYLWANYSDFSVITSPSDDSDAILTQGAINSLLQEFSGIKSVKVIQQNNNSVLEVITSDNQATLYPFPPSITIERFSKRYITQADRNKGCELPLNTQVYSILLSNGNEYIAPIDKYIGQDSSSILLNIIENTVYAELKISNRNSIVLLKTLDDGVYADLNISPDTEGILFNKKDNGLSANIVLQNSDKFIKFSLLTAEQYSNLAELNLIDSTTMYFIKGARYFYFGQYKMAGSSGSIILDDYYTKQQLDNKFKDYITKDELSKELDKTIINWNNV